MIRLLIDAGNSNIKLAIVDGANWLFTAIFPTRQPINLSFTADFDLQQVWVSNVAGPEVARRISEACAAHNWLPHFIISQAQQCGVSNGYESPTKLGSDRWGMLLAAWHRVGSTCLVVGSGTATTIDALSARGEFIGGLILPGIALMQSRLRDGTAGLQAADGHYSKFPRNTSDALLSGAIQAICGAIQRQYELLATPDAPVLLSGGAAHLLLPYLSLPVQMTDNLVLQGLSLISQDEI